jgi:3-keto-5-aminohexanoate cleavage enzyme
MPHAQHSRVRGAPDKRTHDHCPPLSQQPHIAVRRLATRMRELGIKPEIEVYDTGHLDVALALHAEGLLAEPRQFSMVLGVRGGAAATPENLMEMVGRLPARAAW